jgi:hypothetical protein
MLSFARREQMFTALPLRADIACKKLLYSKNSWMTFRSRFGARFRKSQRVWATSGVHAKASGPHC